MYAISLSRMIVWRQIKLQDAISPVISQLSDFYDHAIFFLVLVITFVTCATIALILNNYKCRNIYEAQEIETVWTVLPALILLFLAVPSLRLLYLIDEVNNPFITIKTIAHQWYWTYEYSDFINIEFDSYIIPETDLLPGDHRLLEVDNRLVVPFQSQIRILVTRADVIHRWTIPRLGVKIDAIPGRLNQISFYVNSRAVLYGQCSEICGANHSFIPITLEAVNFEAFTNWINQISEYDNTIPIPLSWV